MAARNSIELIFARWWFLRMESGARRRLWIKLSKLIANGVPILQGMQSMLARRLASKGKGDPMVIALQSWCAEMKNGRRLAQAADGWVSPVEKMLIGAGEMTGTMEGALASTARVMEAQAEIRATVIKGLAYPLILVVLAFSVLYLFGFKVVPEFTKIVAAEKFTGPAHALIAMSNFARDWIVVMALGMIGLFALLMSSFPRWDGPLRVRLDRYPPYAIYRVVVGSTWLISLSAMLEASIRLEDALQKLSEMADKWLRTRINTAMRGMRSGLSLGDALEAGGQEFPDREIIDDLGVYTSLSGFNEAISLLGREWLSESVAQIKARMNFVFGVALLCAALLIGTMMGGMMSMQLQMSQIIQVRGR